MTTKQGIRVLADDVTTFMLLLREIALTTDDEGERIWATKSFGLIADAAHRNMGAEYAFRLCYTLCLQP